MELLFFVDVKTCGWSAQVKEQTLKFCLYKLNFKFRMCTDFTTLADIRAITSVFAKDSVYFTQKNLLFLFYTITFTKHPHQFIYYTHIFIKIIISLTFFIISHLTLTFSLDNPFFFFFFTASSSLSPPLFLLHLLLSFFFFFFWESFSFLLSVNPSQALHEDPSFSSK